MIEALALYCLEIVRYIIGSRLLFDKRVRRRWVALVFGVLYAGYVGILVWHPRGEKYLEIDLIVYVVVFFAVLLMLEGKIGKKIFQVFCLLCVFACLDQLIEIGIFHIFGGKKYTLLQSSIMECFMTNVILCVLYLMKSLADRHAEKTGDRERESIYVAVLFVSMCLTGAACGIGMTQRKVLKETGSRYDVFGGITYLCIIGIILFVFYIKKVNEQEMRLVKTQQKLNDMQKEYYQSLLEKEQETKKYRHDMNSHLMHLHELVKGNDEAETYIAELLDKLVKIKGKCYLTGNETLDILLNHYLSTDSKAEIMVIGKCKSSPSVSSVDLCIIFSNLIKNALESLERENLEEKYIHVNIKPGRQNLMIEIKNSSHALISENDKEVKTKKADAKNHGIGLFNVREAVEKNGGTFSLSGDGKEVTAKVALRVEN